MAKNIYWAYSYDQENWYIACDDKICKKLYGTEDDIANIVNCMNDNIR